MMVKLSYPNDETSRLLANDETISSYKVNDETISSYKVNDETKANRFSGLKRM